MGSNRTVEQGISSLVDMLKCEQSSSAASHALHELCKDKDGNSSEIGTMIEEVKMLQERQKAVNEGFSAIRDVLNAAHAHGAFSLEELEQIRMMNAEVAAAQGEEAHAAVNAEAPAPNAGIRAAEQPQN